MSEFKMTNLVLGDDVEKLSDNGCYLRVWEKFSGIKAFFATKKGSMIGYPFYKEEIFSDLGLLDVTLVGHHQTHSTNVEVITPEMVSEARKGDNRIVFEGVDGAITNVNGVLLTSRHADCIPLFFYDPVLKVIGMVHSGWRGTADEIGRITIEKMVSVYGCRPADIYVHIGPGISKCCFEVDEPCFREFRDPEYTTNKNKYYIDLKAYNKRMMVEAGVDEARISVSEHCTCCEPELFASHRYDGSKLRMGGGIILMDKTELARKKHETGYNCAQSVACSFADEVGVDESILYKACEGFGGGLGCGKGMCGALSGAAVLAGMVSSDGDVEHPGKTKRNSTMKSAMMLKYFAEKTNGETICYDLKGAGGTKPQVSCSDCITYAVEAVEEVLGL